MLVFLDKGTSIYGKGDWYICTQSLINTYKGLNAVRLEIFQNEHVLKESWGAGEAGVTTRLFICTISLSSLTPGKL